MVLKSVVLFVGLFSSGNGRGEVPTSKEVLGGQNRLMGVHLVLLGVWRTYMHGMVVLAGRSHGLS